jgi:hypothetical protein
VPSGKTGGVFDKPEVIETRGILQKTDNNAIGASPQTQTLRENHHPVLYLLPRAIRLSMKIR